MRRPPRRADQRLFSLPTVAVAVLQGLSVLAACLVVFLLSREWHGDDTARALTFTTLVVSLFAVILMNRSWARSTFAMLRVGNAALWWVIAGGSVLLAIVLFVVPVRQLFSFAPVHVDDVGLSLLAGLACLAWFEVLKLTSWWRSLQVGREKRS
jgi:Ca2+-transporting ATPase